MPRAGGVAGPARLSVPFCSWRVAASGRCRTARSTAGAAARTARAGGAPRTPRPASAPPAGHNSRVTAERIGTERVGSALPAPHSPRPPGSYGHAAPSSGPCSAAAAPGTKTTLAPLRLPPPPCCSARRDRRKCVILPRGGVARQQERAGAERAPSPSNGALLAPPRRAPHLLAIGPRRRAARPSHGRRQHREEPSRLHAVTAAAAHLRRFLAGTGSQAPAVRHCAGQPGGAQALLGAARRGGTRSEAPEAGAGGGGGRHVSERHVRGAAGRAHGRSGHPRGGRGAGPGGWGRRAAR